MRQAITEATPALWKNARHSFPGALRAEPVYVFLLKVLLLAMVSALFSACSGKLGSREIRSGLQTGNLAVIRETAATQLEEARDMDSALNLGRMLQLEGDWRGAITAYDRALEMLEEYESRAVHNIRSMSGTAGLFTLDVGARGYFGAGYERSLLHTFNALNYLMLGDAQGAAVELRKMEFRQELWLKETEERRLKAAENAAENGEAGQAPDTLPEGFSLREALKAPDVQNLLNAYQDAFSYALSAIVNQLAENALYAEVSRRRAVHLDARAGHLFAEDSPDSDKGRGGGADKLEEVIVITVSGLAPALAVETRRMFVPTVGPLRIELPSYHPPLQYPFGPEILADGRSLETVPLLEVTPLAYRTLADEMPYELAAAISRAVIRAPWAHIIDSLDKSNKQNGRYDPTIDAVIELLGGLLLGSWSDGPRNWETLPSRGFLTRARLPEGTEISVHMGDAHRKLTLPPCSKAVIILVSYLSHSTMRLDYAAL
jgi:hypothetical protein